MKFKYEPDALQKMITKQNELQEFIGKKRNNIFPKSDVSDEQKIYESIYFWGCATVEYAELIDGYLTALEKDENIIDDKTVNELQIEVIDIFHFIMNIFLYNNHFTLDFDLKDDYEMVWNKKNISYTDVQLRWSQLSIYIGDFINNMKYKKWKTYKEHTRNYENEKNIIDMIITNVLYIAKFFGLNYDTFYDAYMTKLQENYDRQTKGRYKD